MSHDEKEHKKPKHSGGEMKPFTHWGQHKKVTGDWRYKAVLGCKIHGYECSEEDFDAQLDAAGKIELR